MKGPPFAPLVVAGFIAIASASASAQTIPVRRYTTEDGLPHDRVNCIVEDSHGFVWFCTPQGLSRFDGYGFVTFDERHGLPGASVNHILQTSAGEYWIATEAGACRFAADTSRCEPHVFSDDGRDRRVNLLYRDRAAGLWAGTVGETFRLDAGAGAFSRVHIGAAGVPRRNLRAIAEDALGSLWFAMWTSTWQRLPDGTLQRRSFGAGADDGSTALLLDTDSRLWVGHRSGLMVMRPSPTGEALTVTDAAPGAVRWPDMPGQAIRLRTFDGASLAGVRALQQTGDGAVWIALDEGGVVRVEGGRFHRVPPPRGLETFDVITFACDRDGNLWAGTRADGAVKMTRPPFATYDEARGLPPSPILSIFEDRGGAVVAVTGDGALGRFDGGRFTTIRPSLPPNFVSRITQLGPMALQDRAGAWWFRTGRELFRFTVPGFEALAGAAPSWRAGSIGGVRFDAFSKMRVYEDSRGDVWIGATSQREATLTRWDRATGTFERRPLPATVVQPPAFFAEDRHGNLWLGLSLGGLVRCDAKACMAIDLGEMHNVPINGFYLDQSGRLWIAAERAGLWRIDDPSADRPAVVMTTAPAFTGRIVRSVTGDRQGRLYVGTENGIDRFDPDTGQVKRFTTADGLAANEQLTAFSDRRGTLWFGTVRGLSSYVPPPEESAAPPPVHISDVRIAGSAQPLSAVGATSVAGLQLEPDRNQLQVDFASVGAAREILRYQYRLAGVDPDWSAPRPERSVTYARLPPGDYRFLVRAVNANGVSSPAPATVDFHVLAPFWRQGWFLATGLVMAALAAAGVHRYQVRRLIELERVRTRIASDLHDDIGATLSQVAILGEVVRARVGDAGAEVDEPLARISTLSRQSIDSMSDIVWAIDPHKDRMEHLAQRMRRHASEVLAPLGITFSFDVADERLALDAGVRREVFLVFKEALNNAVRHADCRTVAASLRSDGSWLALTVADDGRGFDPARVAAGHGLGSVRRRAEGLGGSLEIAGTAGTRLTLRIPYRGTHLNR